MSNPSLNELKQIAKKYALTTTKIVINRSR